MIMSEQVVYIYEDEKWEVQMDPIKPKVETKFEHEVTLTSQQVHDIMNWNKEYIEGLMDRYKEPEFSLNP